MNPAPLLVVAGEVSGDQHAASLLRELKTRVPGLSPFGLAGDQCHGLGMDLLAHQKQLAVVGLVEALGKVRFAARLAKTLVNEARKRNAAGAILVDSPDFNLPLARKLKKAGIPVVFYVSPQVWAWRSRRAKKLDKRGRAILVLFEFEKRWYETRGLGQKVEWVGHPLVDAAEEELKFTHPAPKNGRPRIVLMPGSREGEIKSLLPVMTRAVSELRSRIPPLDVVLVRADSVPESLLRQMAGPDLDSWTVVSGPHMALLAASDVLIVASGTATVEGLLAHIPMVVLYKVHPLSYFIGKRIIRVPHIAMANIVSDSGDGEKTVPELIQKDAAPGRVATEVMRFLTDGEHVARTRERLRRGAAGLGSSGAAARAATAVIRALSLENQT